MELAELTAYAGEKYHIQEQHKWTDFPGFSVLCDSDTGQWIALLMRQWDMDSGTQIECCDLKCGQQCLTEYDRPYLAYPIRMRGQKWISIAFDDRTEPEVVFSLFDRAVNSGEENGYTIILDSAKHTEGKNWQDTALPFAGSTYIPPKEKIPERLRQMKHLFAYGRESLEARANNFYRQGKYMQDYEDDYPWRGEFFCYFPTYHDLTTSQLRGYFTWRTHARKGEFFPIPTSAAYLYIYELLNGIGTASPEDSLKKLRAFEEGYLDSGIGDGRIRQNLRRWTLDFCVIHNLPPETAREYADPELLEKDASLTVLQNPQIYPDEEVFAALCRFTGKRQAESPVILGEPFRGRKLFSKAWRTAVSGFQQEGKDLFALCFGKPTVRRWYPLSNAVYRQQEREENRDYLLNENRIYRCRNGVWQAEAYEKLTFDRDSYLGFLHETDLRLRRYLKTGRYLRGREKDTWADRYIDAAIESDRRTAAEAARPKITIDLSGLDKIRKDALTTQNSLLTEEELAEAAAVREPTAEEDRLPEADASEPASDSLHVRILKALLHGEPVTELLKAGHLMPTIVADEINEEFFDEFGDSILSCEDDILSLVEDYREDLAYLLD